MATVGWRQILFSAVSIILVTCVSISVSFRAATSSSLQSTASASDGLFPSDISPAITVVPSANVTRPSSWPFQEDTPLSRILVWFIHVGKAGGMSLYQQLNISHSGEKYQSSIACRMEHGTYNDTVCPTTTVHHRSVLAQRIMGHLHMYAYGYFPPQQKWLIQNSNLLVFTTRDPGKHVVPGKYRF